MKRFILLFSIVFVFITSFAQSPNYFNYQAVVRDSNNELVANQEVNFRLFKREWEHNLIQHLGKFPNIVKEAATHYKPSLICRYLLDLAQIFNEFYHKHKVLTEDEELTKARLLLIDSTRQVLANGLILLGIEAPERM